MWPLISYFWKLCTFKVGPEQAPNYPSFLLLVLSLFFVFNVFTQLAFGDDSFKWVSMDSLLLALILVFILGGLLHLFGFKHRAIATIGAFLGADTFLKLLYFPMKWVMFNSHQVQGLLEGIFLLIVLIMLCWDLAVKGHILQRALNIGAFTAMSLAVAITLGALYCFSQLRETVTVLL